MRSGAGLLILFWSLKAFATSTVTVQYPISMYGKPDFESPIVLTIEEGTEVLIGDKAYGAFKKVKVTALGKSMLGYVAASDLTSQRQPKRPRDWGVGGGALFTRYAQAAKSFSTADDVNYTVSAKTGQNLSPQLTFQYGERTFWRAIVAYRSVDMTASAKTDIVGVPSQPVALSYKMLALEGQLAWTLWADYWYGGFGFEAAKTVSGSAKLGNQTLSNDSQPDYLSGHGFSGVQIPFTKHLTAYGEVRIGAVSNQQPIITVVELAASVLYWP